MAGGVGLANGASAQESESGPLSSSSEACASIGPVVTVINAANFNESLSMRAESDSHPNGCRIGMEVSPANAEAPIRFTETEECAITLMPFARGNAVELQSSQKGACDDLQVREWVSMPPLAASSLGARSENSFYVLSKVVVSEPATRPILIHWMRLDFTPTGSGFSAWHHTPGWWHFGEGWTYSVSSQGTFQSASGAFLSAFRHTVTPAPDVVGEALWGIIQQQIVFDIGTITYAWADGRSDCHWTYDVSGQAEFLGIKLTRLKESKLCQRGPSVTPFGLAPQELSANGQ